MKKGKLIGIVALVVIAIAAFGGNKNNSSTSVGAENKSSSVSSVSSKNTSVNQAETTSAPKSLVQQTKKPTDPPKPTDTPTPNPTAIPELKSGNKGESVTELQNLLIKYGYLSGNASGTYDNNTVKAVKDFQINNGMKETGVCNDEVWDKITNYPRSQETVYKSKKGKVYHSKSDCSGMKTATAMTLSDALRKGLSPCSHCH